MFKFEFKDTGWWFWLITVLFLSAGVYGLQIGFLLAIGFTVFQLVYFSIKLKSLTAFPVQVRAFYLILLIISLPESLQWLYWIPTVGTWAQVFVGYCLMARCVSLLPWNRTEKFSIELFNKTIFSRPVRGTVQQGATEEGHQT